MSFIRTRSYIVVMSNKDPVRIDEEELEKVVQMSAEGKKLIVLKQGVINPAYIVDIQLDRQRIKEWEEELRYKSKEERALGLPALGHIYSPLSSIAAALVEKGKELEKRLSPPTLDNKNEGNKIEGSQ